MWNTDRKPKNRISRADLLLPVLIVALALGLRILFVTGNQTGTAGTREGLTLIISCDGEEAGTLDLAADEKWRAGAEGRMRYCLLLYTKGGIFRQWYEEEPSLSDIPEGVSYNILSVSAEGVSMEAADCRDQICVHHVPITGSGESIICLPHKLVVEIKSDAEEPALDGMVK